MEVIRDREFRDGEPHRRQVICDLQLEDCTFDGWAGLHPEWPEPDPADRPTIRNVHLRNTRAYVLFVDGLLFEDVVVETTKAGRHPLFLNANAYKHVRLQGRIGQMCLRGRMFSQEASEEELERVGARWDEANAAYYENVDWALDITDASFGSFEISGVPGRLIRRDPETSVLVSREQAMEGRWRDLEYHCSVYHYQIGCLLDESYEDVLLVACKRSRNFKYQMEDLATLRTAGVGV